MSIAEDIKNTYVKDGILSYYIKGVQNSFRDECAERSKSVLVAGADTTYTFCDGSTLTEGGDEFGSTEITTG